MPPSRRDRWFRAFTLGPASQLRSLRVANRYSSDIRCRPYSETATCFHLDLEHAQAALDCVISKRHTKILVNRQTASRTCSMKAGQFVHCFVHRFRSLGESTNGGFSWLTAFTTTKNQLRHAWAAPTPKIVSSLFALPIPRAGLRVQPAGKPRPH